MPASKHTLNNALARSSVARPFALGMRRSTYQAGNTPRTNKYNSMEIENRSPASAALVCKVFSSMVWSITVP